MLTAVPNAVPVTLLVAVSDPDPAEAIRVPTTACAPRECAPPPERRDHGLRVEMSLESAVDSDVPMDASHDRAGNPVCGDNKNIHASVCFAAVARNRL